MQIGKGEGFLVSVTTVNTLVHVPVRLLRSVECIDFARASTRPGLG